MMIDFYGAALIFMLGLCHGLDPDHIAVIDGMGMQLAQQQNKIAPWVGSLFALGHGLVVTVIALSVSLGSRRFNLPMQSFTWLQWLPVLLMLFVGSLNLHSLLYKPVYKPAGWRQHFIPARLRNSTHPLAILLVGVLFALVFDTATQAAAWGYAASLKGSSATALYIGGIFTLGMVITDTIDGRLLYQIIRKSSQNKSLLQYRRMLGWIIVVSSFAIAGYKILSHFQPSLTLTDTGNLIAGLLLMGAVIITYVNVFLKLSKTKLYNGN